MAKEITAANFEEVVLKETKPVLVDFWATWCGPCQMVGPVIEEIAEEYEGRAVVGKINVDEQEELAMKYKIMTIPTIMIFKDGEVVEKAVGVKPKKEFCEMIDKQL